jgi:oligopeptide transport system substrate-binding protein
MKRIVFSILLAAMVAFIAAGCVGRGRSTYTDVYKASFKSEYPSLNYYTTYYAGAKGLVSNCIDGLVEPNRYGVYVPSLAESWSASDDDKVWTFKLRKGVKWVDCAGGDTGKEVVANNFVDAMRYVADPTNGAYGVKTPRNLIVGMADYYSLLNGIAGGAKSGITREQALATFDQKVGVKALDDHTVQYTLNTCTPYFLSLIEGCMLFLPIPYDYAMQQGADFGIDGQHLLYCGAYYISDFQRDKRITLTANPTYWDAKNVHLKKIEYQKVPDGTTGLEMFQRGEIDECTVDSEQYQSLKGGDWKKYLIPRSYSEDTNYFWLNFTSRNPEFKAFCNNTNFRKALQYSINRKALAAMRDPEQPARLVRNTIVAEGIIYDNNGVDYTDYAPLETVKATNYYNKDLAKDYMKKAIAELCDANGNIKGVKPAAVDMLPITKFNVDGKLPVTMLYVGTGDEQEILMAQLIARMLTEALGAENIDVKMGFATDSFYSVVLDKRNFDTYYDSLSVVYADPFCTLGRVNSDGEENVGQYSVPEADGLIAKAMATSDTAARYQLFAKAEASLIDGAYVIPFISSLRGYYMTRIEPYSYALTRFGVQKYKGAKVLTKPLTLEDYSTMTQAYEKARANALKQKR